MRPDEEFTYIYKRRRWLRLFGTIDRIGGLYHRPRLEIPDLSSVRSIVVVKLDQVGDLILTQPLLALLRQGSPDARITLIVGKDRGQILESAGTVDAIMEVPVRLRPGETGTRFAPGGLLASLRRIRALRPEVTVAAKEEPFTVLLARLIDSPVRIGFREGGLGFLLTHTVRIDASRHEWQNLAALAGGDGRRGKPPLYSIRGRAEQEAGALLASMAIVESMPLVIVHPGSGILSRRWPWDRFAESMKLVSRELPVTFLIVQGHEDGVRMDDHPDLAPPARVLRLPDHPAFETLAALIARADLLLGNESAPSHLAAAVGTPAVVPFLSGNDPRRWGPAGAGSRVLVGDVGEGPTPAAMAATILEVLNRSEAGRGGAAGRGGSRP